MAEPYLIQFKSPDLQNLRADDTLRAKYCLSVLPEFHKAVQPFWEIFAQDEHGRIKKEELQLLVQNLLTFFFVQMDKTHRQQVADILLSQFATAPSVTFYGLSALLAEVCFLFVENCDVRGSISFLKFVLSRTSYVSALNIEDGRVVAGENELDLNVYEKEKVEGSCVQEKERMNLYAHPIYYEEVVLPDAKLQALAQSTDWVLSRKLLSPESIIPLGYCAESFIYFLRNQEFSPRKTYQLVKKEGLKLGSHQAFRVSIESGCLDRMRDKICSNLICRQFAVFKQNLVEFNSTLHDRMCEFYRLNTFVNSPLYFQELKTRSGELKRFNILSIYFQREEYLIDQKFEVRQKMDRKKLRKKNDIHEQKIKKPKFQQQQFSRRLLSSLMKEAFKFRDEKRLISLNKFLECASSTQSPPLNLQKYMSRYFSMPRDNVGDDLINLSISKPPQILVIGKPLTGKSTFCAALSKRLEVVHIECAVLINKLFEKVKFYEENPPQTDEDGNPKQVFSKVQKCILQDLQNGKSVDNNDLLDLINEELTSPGTRNKGFILDLPLDYQGFNWLEKMLNGDILLPRNKCLYFTHVIQLNYSAEQQRFVNSLLYERVDDLKRFSHFDITMNNRPPKKFQPVDPDDEPPPEQQPIPPIFPITLARVFKSSSEHYNKQLNTLTPLLKSLNFKDYIQLNYQTLADQVEIALRHIYIDPRPLPKKIQAGSEKELLTVGLQEKKLFRKWSVWGTIDPVALANGKLVKGVVQFACEFAGYVFMFQNQNALKLFLDNPRKYISRLPCMPQNYNIAIVGPKKSGKKTIAQELSRIYGWKVINFQKIVQQVLQRQRTWTQHQPSNFQKRVKSIHLSEAQWKQFYKGIPVGLKDVMPIVLFQLGVPLQKKPPDWGVEKNQTDEQNPDGDAAKEDQKKKQSKNAPKKKKEKESKEEDRPKTPPPQDLPLKQILPEINHLGKLSQIKGYILIGYPNTAEQLAALKFNGVPIDKLIVLADTSEEPPNKTLGLRLSQQQLEQVETFKNGVAAVKQQLGEDVVRQISIEGTKEEVLIRTQRAIDPFYQKVDVDEHNRVCADVQEEDEPIQWGPTAAYCPVVASEGWLVRGKDDFQAGFKGKRCKFYGQAELNKFKENPQKYWDVRPESIPPRVMFIGPRGAGLRTLLDKMNQKYKVPILSLKQNLLSHIENLKVQRRTDRYFNKGYKPKEFDEEGKEIPDPEIEEEAADFDRKANEVKAMELVFSGLQQLFINGNFFDVQQDKVSTPFTDLLAQAKRLPEAVVLLKVSDKKWLPRVFNTKEVEQEHKRIMEQRRLARLKERDEARQKAIEAGEEYQEPPLDQEDPDAPKLEDMLNERKAKLLQQREADSAKVDQLAETFKGLNVETVLVQCERQASKVFDKVVSLVDKVLTNRKAKFVDNIFRKLSSQRAEASLASNLIVQSRFGKLNPFTLLRPVAPVPVSYKDRLYYLNNQEEYQKVRQDPDTLLKGGVAPRDCIRQPLVFVAGDPKSGKTCLAQQLESSFGLVRLDQKGLFSEAFDQEHPHPIHSKLAELLLKGRQVPDQLMADLIVHRLGKADIIERGCVLDGYPRTTAQARLLTERGVIPSNVFRLTLPELTLKLKCGQPGQGFKKHIMQKRLQESAKSLLSLQNYYSRTFDNLFVIKSNISKHGVFLKASEQILKSNLQSKRLGLSLVLKQAGPAAGVGFRKETILGNLSRFLNFCPVTLKLKQEFLRLDVYSHSYIALFDRKFYFIANEKAYQDFILHPELYAFQTNSVAGSPLSPFDSQLIKLSESIQNKGSCAVELSRNRLRPCDPYLSLLFEERLFGFSSIAAAQLFKKSPRQFARARLPDKLPVQISKKNQVKKIAKKGDCTAFLQHHLGNIIMRVLAQLGFRRLKYPTISTKETALKFIAISLKMYNPNQDERYRQKYRAKMEQFIKHCSYAQEIKAEFKRKEERRGQWTDWEEENLLKLTEEFSHFMHTINTTEKGAYFNQFIC